MERIIQIIYRLGLIVIWVPSILIGGMFLIHIPGVENKTQFFRAFGYGAIPLFIGTAVHFGWRWLLRPKSNRKSTVEADNYKVVSRNRADALTNKDDMWWMALTKKAIENLDKDDPNYSDNKWFFEELFLFYTDRTMHHPNPGIPEDEKYDWELPENITRSYVYDVTRGNAQRNNPYMHPWLGKYEIMGEMGDEGQKFLYDKLNDAIKQYKSGEISYLDLYVVREEVYREIPEFSKLYDDMTKADMVRARIIDLLRPFIREKKY